MKEYQERVYRDVKEKVQGTMNDTMELWGVPSQTNGLSNGSSMIVQQ